MPTTTPTATHPAQQQPREKNLSSDEANERIAPEPLPATDPEVTGAGPVVDDSNDDSTAAGTPAADKRKAEGDSSADTIDMQAGDHIDDSVDTAPDAEAADVDDVDDNNGGIGRDNKGVPP